MVKQCKILTKGKMTKSSASLQNQSDFLIGIATAAHHIEGNNQWSDWWQYEQFLTGGVSSGEACNSYVEYVRDRKLLQQLGCNSYRFSLEWSRLEPSEGKFDTQAIEHYIAVINDLKNHGIEPILTLHHFTNPLWFEQSGGWQRHDAPQIFLKFVKFVLPFLKTTKFFTPINEPNIYVSNKYVGGVWHPYVRNPIKGFKVLVNLATAHKGAYALIKQVIPEAKIGSCVQLVDIGGLRSIWWPLNQSVAGAGAFIFNHLFYLLIAPCMDFVGLNFYSSYSLGLPSLSPWPRIVPHPVTSGKLTMISRPRRLLSALRSVSRYGKPVMITENGKLTENDAERSIYLKAVFAIMRDAIAEGIPLIGYQHFTHMDSFEWGFGFGPQFGLFSHDPVTHEVKAKPSAKVFRELAASFLK